MIRRLLLFIMWFVALPFLSLQAQSPGGVVRTAEGDSTTAANQSMRVVTFKAVPGTERTYYYHRDHLGSTTLITNKSGEVVQRVEYLPTGETFIEQQDTSWVSPHKFNGKELDEETGLYYYGARYYDPRLSMWLGTDPMQGKYPGISTYAFCMGNPVKYLDPDGNRVFALDKLSQRNILNTLSIRESKYVRFNRDGLLDVKRLKKYKGTSTNMNALRVLAESNTDYIFRVSNEDINGMKFFEKGSDSNNPSNYKYGVTNMPNAENDASPDNNVYVYTADFLSELDQAKNVGHEAYGHAYFYELSLSDPTINPSHLKEKVGETIEIDPEFGIIKIPIFGNSNHKLEDQIDSVVNEVLKNYEERNR